MLIYYQFSSLAQLGLTLCDSMDCSIPGFPVHHQFSELTQTHVHWVSDAIQPSHPLLSPSLPAFNLSQHHQGLFQLVSSSHQMVKVLVSASASVLPVNIHDWLPLGLTGLISCSLRDSQESSPAPQFKSISSSVLSFFYGPVIYYIKYNIKYKFKKSPHCSP